MTQAKIKKRQGDNKSVNEVEDIVNIMIKLDEANDLPVFLASSDMVKELPVLNSINTKEADVSDVMNNVKILEESMSSFMEQQKAQVDKLAEAMKVNNQRVIVEPVSKPETHVSRFVQNAQSTSEQPRSPRKRSRNIAENGDSQAVSTDMDTSDPNDLDQTASEWAKVAGRKLPKTERRA